MRKRAIKVLIAHNDSNVLRYLSIQISREFEVLGIYAHILIATTFKETKKIIEREDIDISCFDCHWEDEVGHGEDLIVLIKRIARHQTIIAIMDNVDTNYRLKLYDKYAPILCPTRKLLFSSLRGYLEKTLLGLRSYYQEVVINTHLKVIRFYIEEIAYLKGHAGKTTVFIYDFDAKKYKSIEITLSITNFLAKYDKLGGFLKCHRDYAVNRMMVRFIRKSREYQCIELIYNDEKNYPVEIPMSESGKKNVIKEMDKKVEGAVLT